jgi:hypothetical protein
MNKLLLAALMALGLGMGIASANAATWTKPHVIHNGADYGNDSATAP